MSIFKMVAAESQNPGFNNHGIHELSSNSNNITARCHAPLSLWSVQPFSVNAHSRACESAITSLDNAQCYWLLHVRG